jgi:hypothetical protein
MDCAIPSAEQLPEFQKDQLTAARCIDPNFSDRWLHIAQSPFSDYICLDTTRQTQEGDCPVLLISHETGEVEREWNNIASFLDDLLATDDSATA